MTYILKLLKGQQIHHSNPRKRESVEVVFEEIKYQDIAGEMFIVPAKELPDFLVVVKFADKQEIEKQLPVLIKSLKEIIETEFPLETEDYLGYKISYGIERSPQEISAYTCVNNNMLFSNNIKIIKRAIDVFKGAEESILKNNLFNDIYSRLTKEYAGFIFVNNSNKNLTKILRDWEANHHITVLLSAETLDGLGIFLDFPDEDKFRGKISFITRDDKAIFDEVQDDARFFNDILKRKVLFEKADYSSTITVKGKYADLDLEVKKLKSFWPKVVYGKIRLDRGLELFKPRQEIKETRVEVTPEGKTIYIKKISGSPISLKQKGDSKINPEYKKNPETKSRIFPMSVFYGLVVISIILILKFVIFKRP